MEIGKLVAAATKESVGWLLPGPGALDFYPPKGSDGKDEHGNPHSRPMDDADARLDYVAVTRARTRRGEGP
ncbi:hypothetical protein [Actinacidiphila glaucinigra]|uniref:hypothetical protein n=1 Tax=Actinacidiphila glaucinigra TaxID=235986 RepID=UPI0035D83ACA